jgi:general secretion pathway protein D
LLILAVALLPRICLAQSPPLPPQSPPHPAGVAGSESPSRPQSSTGSITPQAEDPASSESDDLDSALERRGDLNLHGLSLNAALFTISEQWNINVVAGEVQGTVNGVFRDAPLREILDSILLSNGYNYRAVGKSLVVSSIQELGQINPFFQSATIPVRAADIDEVVEGAKLLSTPQGQVRPLKSAHSIIVLDFPDRVQMIRNFVTALDTASSGRFAAPGGREGLPLEVGYFRTQHIAARTAEQVVQTILSNDGRVAVMEKEDRLLVTDYPENLAMVEKVLERIDHPRPQVRITALIYDISLQDIENLGLQWNKLGYQPGDDSSADLAFGTEPLGSLEFTDGAITSLAAGAGNIGFGTLGRNFDINAVILALQEANDARLLANPSVAVLENEEAVFKSVSEIPFQQLTQTQQGGNIGTTSFKEAGITLTVTPKIAVDGTILMTVSPEFSRLAGFTPGDNQPIIDTRSATTSLTVANRQTVVIGGLRQRSDIGDFSGVPYLKDLKLFGRLFRSRSTDVRESELVVFISPEIISYADEPTWRQQMAADTIRCRLDQIPEAEGCPPCCRRLPLEPCQNNQYCGDPAVEPAGEPASAGGHEFPPAEPDNPAETLPPPQSADPPPLSADQIPSAELQFGAAGRYGHVRVLLAEGRLRRLPTVQQRGSITTQPAANGQELFSAPPSPPPNVARRPGQVQRR